MRRLEKRKKTGQKECEPTGGNKNERLLQNLEILFSLALNMFVRIPMYQTSKRVTSRL